MFLLLERHRFGKRWLAGFHKSLEEGTRPFFETRRFPWGCNDWITKFPCGKFFHFFVRSKENLIEKFRNHSHSFQSKIEIYTYQINKILCGELFARENESSRGIEIRYGRVWLMRMLPEFCKRTLRSKHPRHKCDVPENRKQQSKFLVTSSSQQRSVNFLSWLWCLLIQLLTGPTEFLSFASGWKNRS